MRGIIDVDYDSPRLTKFVKIPGVGYRYAGRSSINNGEPTNKKTAPLWHSPFLAYAGYMSPHKRALRILWLSM